MGICYSIACEDCKVTRDLDNLLLNEDVETREGMIKYTDFLSNKPLYREALLISFMAKHRRHKCILYNDASDDDICEKVDPFFISTDFDKN